MHMTHQTICHSILPTASSSDAKFVFTRPMHAIDGVVESNNLPKWTLLNDTFGLQTIGRLFYKHICK